MAESVIVKHLRDGTLTYAVGANSYVFAFEQGNFQLQVPGPSVALYLDRGRITDPPSIRYNEDQPMNGSFSVYFRDVTDAAYVTAMEFLLKTGQYASLWGTSMGVGGEVKTGTLTWDIAGTTHNDPSNHTLVLPYSTLSGGAADGNPNLITFNFTSYAVYPSSAT